MNYAIWCQVPLVLFWVCGFDGVWSSPSMRPVLSNRCRHTVPFCAFMVVVQNILLRFKLKFM